MPSNNPNIFKRAYENVMGTPEQNKKAKEEIEKYKASKAKEKEKEKEMAKGGDVKKFKPCAECPSAAKCKAAGKCLAKKMAKGGAVASKSGTVAGKGKVTKAGSKAAKTGKTPLLAIMIGIPKAKKK
jgi:hypothetical protein